MDFISEMRKLAVRAQAELSIHQEDDEEPEARLDLKLEGDRGQEVSVSFFEHADYGYLRLTTAVGQAGQLSADRLRQLLTLNSGLVRGAFALAEGSIVLTDTIEASPIDHERAARAIAQLARTADQMERAIIGHDRA